LHELYKKFGSGVPLVEIPGLNEALDKIIRFFDYSGATAVLRLRLVTDANIESQAFLSLLNSDAVILLTTGKAEEDGPAQAALNNHFKNYETLPVLLKIAGSPRKTISPDKLMQIIETELARQKIRGKLHKKLSQAYQKRALALSAAVDVAIALKPGQPNRLEIWTKQSAFHPELGFAKLSSLKSLETAFFTYWNEGAGEDVDAFWREIRRQHLPFHRRDVIADVLKN
jgi:hypothetical protein